MWRLWLFTPVFIFTKTEVFELKFQQSNKFTIISEGVMTPITPPPLDPRLLSYHDGTCDVPIYYIVYNRPVACIIVLFVVAQRTRLKRFPGCRSSRSPEKIHFVSHTQLLHGAHMYTITHRNIYLL